MTDTNHTDTFSYRKRVWQLANPVLLIWGICCALAGYALLDKPEATDPAALTLFIIILGALSVLMWIKQHRFFHAMTQNHPKLLKITGRDENKHRRFEKTMLGRSRLGKGKEWRILWSRFILAYGILPTVGGFAVGIAVRLGYNGAITLLGTCLAHLMLYAMYRYASSFLVKKDERYGH